MICLHEILVICLHLSKFHLEVTILLYFIKWIFKIQVKKSVQFFSDKMMYFLSFQCIMDPVPFSLAAVCSLFNNLNLSCESPFFSEVFFPPLFLYFLQKIVVFIILYLVQDGGDVNCAGYVQLWQAPIHLTGLIIFL